MNNVNITVELCSEDRARIDRLTGALEARVRQVQYCLDNNLVDVGEPDKATEDDIAKMAREALENAKPTEGSKNAPEAPEVLDHPTLDPFPETPTAAEEPSEAPTEEAEPTVTMDMLTNKALTLSANGKRDQVKEIVHVYAPKVTALPEDKWVEVYKKLTALEG